MTDSPALECFALVPNPPQIVPGRVERPWMDEFTGRWAYRCLPMTVANASGWELLCPVGFSLEWNGGAAASDVTVIPDDPTLDISAFVKSHFSCGTVTFDLQYLFRTSPEWAVWCRGPPNAPKHGIAALDGVIETDWLPQPFTMNWLFTAPGRVRFEADEPFCFITLLRHQEIDGVQPVGRAIEDAPDLQAQMLAWGESRTEFTKRRDVDFDPAARKEMWQRFYFKGEPPAGGGPAPERHVNKRRLREPK